MKDKYFWVILIACLIAILFPRCATAQTVVATETYQFAVTSDNLIEGIVRKQDSLSIDINDYGAFAHVTITHRDRYDVNTGNTLVMYPVSAEFLPAGFGAQLVDRGDNFVPIDILATPNFSIIILVHRSMSGDEVYEVAYQRLRHQQLSYYSVFQLQKEERVVTR